MPQITQSTVKLLIATALLVMTLSFFGVPLVSAIPDYPFTGNSTILSKPGFPVAIEEGQIPIGEVWTYQVPLVKNKQYHIYLIGDWVDLEQHVTDYDIFFYKKRYSGEVFISSHTEAAGYPEQVSNDGLGHFFTPESMGEWSIRAEVVQDGIYTASAISPPKYLDVRDPTVAYRVADEFYSQSPEQTP